MVARVARTRGVRRAAARTASAGRSESTALRPFGAEETDAAAPLGDVVAELLARYGVSPEEGRAVFPLAPAAETPGVNEPCAV